jgi:hypothetical protein
MKTKLVLKLGIWMVVLGMCSGVLAADGSSVSLGVRHHSGHSVVPEIPFEEGDWSYCVAYEYHEDTGCWQLVLDFSPEVGGSAGIDYVLTPEMNLIFSDSSFKLGMGILASYVSSDTLDDWTDMYWQFLAGFDLELGGLDFDLMTYYVFEDWGELGDFDTKDLEYGAWINFPF